MEVDEILDYEHYYHDQRFADKIPDCTKEKVIYKSGDNIYKPLPNGGFQQLRSMHSNGEQENPETKAHDLGGVNVLVGRRFHYFGASSLKLPLRLKNLKVRRGHKNRFSEKTITDFLQFISPYTQKVSAPPTNWPAGDSSWQQEQG